MTQTRVTRRYTEFGMPLTVLFVHGTGVRQPSYSDTLARIRTRLERLRPDVKVEPCYWGETCGARLNAGGLSIPQYDTTRSIGEVASEEDLEVTLWELLNRDPLFECRLLALSAASGPFSRPGNAGLLERVASGLPDTPPALRSTGIDEATLKQIDRSLRWVAAQREYRALIDTSTDTGGCVRATARAVVARAMLLPELEEETSGGPLAMSVDATLRDAVVGALVTHLQGSSRGFAGAFVGTVLAPLNGLALRSASWWAKRHRGTLADATSFMAGDILVYQAAGEGIRNFIRDRIRETRADVLIAHSLGGIACVESLVEVPEPSVKLLVTVGSQAPYLYELNALRLLRFEPTAKPEDRLPEHFPRWLNVFDDRDLASFVGRGIFGGRVVDERVNNRLPFPRSHSGYWSNDRMWDVIREALPEIR
jgi:hypothetical protein